MSGQLDSHVFKNYYIIQVHTYTYTINWRSSFGIYFNESQRIFSIPSHQGISTLYIWLIGLWVYLKRYAISYRIKSEYLCRLLHLLVCIPSTSTQIRTSWEASAGSEVKDRDTLSRITEKWSILIITFAVCKRLIIRCSVRGFVQISVQLTC